MYDSLHRNLRLWSVTPNESSFGKIGHDESGSKQEFISFYNFLATEYPTAQDYPYFLEVYILMSDELHSRKTKNKSN